MYSLMCNLGTGAALAREGSTLITSLVLAEVFYKFHSFSLECLAFLATWAALSGSIDLAARLLGNGGGPPGEA